MFYIAIMVQEQEDRQKACITNHGDFGHGTGAYCVMAYPKGEWREFWIEDDKGGKIRAAVGEFITDYMKEKQNGNNVRNARA